MKKHSDDIPDWEAQRNRIIGLGETSIRKSYYPELQQRILELEKKNRELQAAYAEQTAVEEELRQQIDETGRKERELRVNEERLIMAQEIAHLGSWEYSFETNKIWGSAEALRIYGFPPVSGYHPLENIEACVVDREHVQQAFVDFIHGRREYDIEITVNPRNGSSQRVVRSIARLEKDDQDRPLRVVGVLQDITERKRAEDILRESEAFLTSIIENIPLMLFIKDASDLRFVRFNQAGEELLGYSREELVGKNDHDFFDKEQADFFTSKDREVLAGKIPLDIPEENIETRTRGQRILHTKKIPILNSNGEPQFLLGISEDITERKTAEKALQNAKEFAEMLIETANAMIIGLDTGGNITIFNQTATEITGYTSPELANQNWFEVIVPRDRYPKVWEEFNRLLAGGLPTQFENPILTKSGEERYILWRNGEIHESGVIVGTLSFGIDITKRKKAEEDLKVSEERYRALVEVTETGYIVLNDRGMVIDANEVYLRLTGRSSIADLLGHPVTDWTAPYDLERNAREVEKCLQTGYVRGLEIDYLRPDGTVQPIEVNATIFHGLSGYVILTLCRDISDRRRAQVALQQARNKLNLLNAVTFQDIQTAAFSLSAYQELVKNMLTDQKAKSYVEKQGLFLKKMMDTLDFAKNYQEMGMHPPRWQNVRQVFLYAISHLDFLHMKQNLQLDNLEIFADPLFEKTLFNLMQNVLIHGVNATEVTLRYEVKSDNIMLFIEDNGMGIPPEEKNMIFDRGYGKGTGLGLFLVREVLSITGITIRETGTKGQGTRFEITVPKGMYRYTR